MKQYLYLILGSSLLLSGCSGTSPRLGVSAGVLSECPKSPNCVNSQAKDEEHAIEAIKISGTLSEAKSKILQTLEVLDNSKLVSSDSNYIRVEFTSSLFRFVDDVEFYLPESSTGTVTVEVRSASRIGHSDLGVNRKRIEAIRSKLQ